MPFTCSFPSVASSTKTGCTAGEVDGGCEDGGWSDGPIFAFVPADVTREFMQFQESFRLRVVWQCTDFNVCDTASLWVMACS